MKKGALVLALAGLLGLPGCLFKKKRSEQERKQSSRRELASADIPVANELVDFTFNEDKNEYALLDELNNDFDAIAMDEYLKEDAQLTQGESFEDFSWTSEDTAHDSFRVVYFDFDSFAIRPDQEEVVSYNVTLAQKMIQEGQSSVMLRIEGNADDSAGAKAYNLALSERRACALKDRMVAAGIPADRIKIIALGSENPVLVEGKRVSGDRNEQWPNRRDEVNIIRS